MHTPRKIIVGKQSREWFFKPFRKSLRKSRTSSAKPLREEAGEGRAKEKARRALMRE